MDLQEEFDNQLSEAEKELFRYSETAYYIGYSNFLEQCLETASAVDTIVNWRLLEDEKPLEKGWYLVATDDEWRRDFWDGEDWHGQGKSKYTKYFAEVKTPKAN